MDTTPVPAENGNGTANDQGSTSIVAPYEGLHSVVHFGVTPWFDSYVSAKKVGVSLESAVGKKGAEAQMGQ